MKQKPTLLLLHGALGSKQHFAAFRSLLQDEFDLLDLDFDGHGTGPDTEEYSIDRFTQNVRDLLHVKGLQAVSIFGYSMGGYVALNLAIQNPELVGKIVTLGTKFDWNPESSKKEAGMLVPEVLEEKVPAFAEKLKKEHYPKDWKKLVRGTAEMMLRMGNGETIPHDDLRKVTCEVVIAWGSRDRMVSKEESVLLASLLPNSSFLELDDVQHPLEQISMDKMITFIEKSLFFRVKES